MVVWTVWPILTTAVAAQQTVSTERSDAVAAACLSFAKQMLIYLSTENLDAALPFVIELLENEMIYENRLADSATVGTSPLDEAERPADFAVVYPNAEAGARMG